MLLVVVILAVLVVLVQVLMLLRKISAPKVEEEVKEDLRGESAPLFSDRWCQSWSGFGVQLQDDQRILI